MKELLNYEALIALMGKPFLQDNVGKKRKIIVIDGYYASGKTTLASSLTEYFAEHGVTANILCTDEFMLYSRKTRESNLEIYNNRRSWYDLKKLESLLEVISNRAPVNVNLTDLYSHQTGEKDVTKELRFDDNSICIVEGVFCCDPLIRRFADVSLFIISTHEKMLSHAILRDKLQRGLTANDVRKRYRLLNGSNFHDYFQEIWTSTDILVDLSKFSRPKVFVWKSSTALTYGVNKFKLENVAESISKMGLEFV